MQAMRVTKFAALSLLLMSIPLERATAQDASTPPAAQGTRPPATQSAPASPAQATSASPATTSTPKAPRSTAKRRAIRRRHYAGPPEYYPGTPIHYYYFNYGPYCGPYWQGAYW